MSIAIDTSAVIAVLLDEPTRPAILDATRDQELIAPPTLSWEIANALSAMVKRRRIVAADASAVLELFSRIPIRIRDVPLESVLEIAASLDIYAYDACMIVCAQHSHAPLLTLDRGLRYAAQRTAVDLVEL